MVTITTLSNGILFDTSTLPGSGVVFARKYFRPKNYPGVNFVSLYNHKVIASSTVGEDFNLTLNGADSTFPVGSVNGVTPTTLDELFTFFINSLV